MSKSCHSCSHRPSSNWDQHFAEFQRNRTDFFWLHASALSSEYSAWLSATALLSSATGLCAPLMDLRPLQPSWMCRGSESTAVISTVLHCRITSSRASLLGTEHAAYTEGSWVDYCETGNTIDSSTALRSLLAQSTSWLAIFSKPLKTSTHS